MVTIKKYSNRRLYDTSTSEYITLEELAAKIRAGTDVRVLKADTEAEITQEILAQIILESRGAARLLPVPLLVRLIRMGDDLLAEFFGQFMSWSLELYLRFKKGAETMKPYNPFGRDDFSGPEALFQMFMKQSPWSGEPPWQEGGVSGDFPEAEPPESQSPPEASGAESDDGEATSEEVEALRREIDDLKDVLNSIRAEADE